MQQRRRFAITFGLVALVASGCSGPSSPTDTGTGQDAGPDITNSDSPLSDTPNETSADVPSSDATDATDASDVPPLDGGTPGDHLLISEIVTQPAGGEYVEIFNPGSSAVDLSNYYLSDNASYYTIAQGLPWNPPTMNPGTDFLAQFPAGASIASHAAIVIATDPTFPMVFNRCPDYILAASPLACPEGGMARAMVAPPNGDLGTMPGQMLSNAREMVVLFRWSGDTSQRLGDVDYVTWGAMFDNGTRIDKTAVTGYLPDTPRAMQAPAPVPGLMQSIERCGNETGEHLTGGNGITGHDETSERLDMSFRVQTMPTPGVPSVCP